MANVDGIPNSIIEEFERINREVDKDIVDFNFDFEAEKFLDDVDGMGTNDIQAQIDAADAAEAEAEERELLSYLDRQGPLDEEEAANFLNDIEDIDLEMVEEEGIIPEIDFTQEEELVADVATAEDVPLMEGQEERFDLLEERTYVPGEEAGTVGETTTAEVVEDTLEGFTEIALDTEPLLGEAAGEIGAEVGGELTEMAVSSSLEIASTAVGEAAGATLAAVSSAAAFLGPLLAVVGVGLLINTAVDAVGKYNEEEMTKKEYRDNVLNTYTKANEKSREMETFYNKYAAAESKYQDSMYKWVFGWKDPENYPEGRGYQIQGFKYKSDWNSNWSLKEKVDNVARVLGVNPFTLTKKDGFGNLNHDRDYSNQLKKIYEEVSYSKKFRSYIDNQFIGDMVASDFEKQQTYKTNQLLMTRDGRLLSHYQQQSEADSNYKNALQKFTNSINEKRRIEGNPPLTVSQIEYGDARGWKSGTGYIPSKGTVSNIPFWALYYKTNKKKFRQEDAKQMDKRYKEWVARGKTAIKDKVTQADKDFQNSFFFHAKKATEKKGRETRADDDLILEQEISFNQKPLHFRRKRRKKPKEPPKDIPLPEEEEKAKEKPLKPDKKDKQKVEEEKKKDEKKDIAIGVEYLDNGLDNIPHQENGFDKDYYFSISTAEHLCRLCARAYDPPEEIETEEGFDVVEFMGTEDSFQDTQGRMYYSESANVIVIVYRGTDFSRLASLRPDLAIQDIKRDLQVSPTTDEISKAEVHSGFYEYFRQSQNEVAEFVKKYYTEDTIIYTSGHSLGGPPSILCSMFLNKMLDDQVCVNYTFGCPRAFTKETAYIVDSLASPCYRIADTWDFFAGMPPNAFGYFHVGECHAIESRYLTTSAKMSLVTDKTEANDLFNYPILNFTFHSMKHYMASLKFLLEHHNVVGNSFRTESQMIDQGHVAYTTPIKINKNADKTVLMTNNYSYKHTGRYYGNKRIYAQTSAEHLEFIPNYHKGHGLTMTPIPTNLKDAIVGVYMYRENEFPNSGEVKGFVVY